MNINSLFMTLARSLRQLGRGSGRMLAVSLAFVTFAAACGSDDNGDSDAAGSEATTETTAAMAEDDTMESEDASAVGEVSTSVRDSGMTVTVQPLDGVTVHSVTAPEEVFANATHIVETTNSLVVIDTQFLLPNALDLRAYADELGKPIDRVFITHEHPDHFLGSEAFADVPVYALQSVSDLIADIGQTEVDEKQADFGDAIASTYVVPQIAEPGTLDIDGVTFELEQVVDAEAENQLVIKLPDHGVIAVGDIVYNGVHLIMAGAPDTWTAALQGLAATSDQYPIVLPGHGTPTNPTAYDANIAWLATFAELTTTTDNAEDFKQGLIDAYPNLGMTGAIDFVTPFLFPDA